MKDVSAMENYGEILIYQSDDGLTNVEVKIQDETVWLTQQQMAELFQTSRINVVEHIKHIYDEGELDEISTCRKFRQVRKEGKREIAREIPFYNLDMIISLGYRVKSIIATNFRRWATERLKEYRKTGEEISDIEYELIPCDGFIGSKEFDLDKTIYDLNSRIKLLSSQADKLDYIVAIASGIACGILDILLVGDFDLTNGRNVVSDKTDDFVKKIAEMLEGKKMNDVKSAVKALEKRFPIPSDGNTPDFGGGLQHHLRDFAHHPTIVGLAFSLLTQFTEKSYGTDANGVFLVVDIKEKSNPFIGKDISQKILMGTITWFSIL